MAHPVRWFAEPPGSSNPFYDAETAADYERARLEDALDQCYRECEGLWRAALDLYNLWQSDLGDALTDLADEWDRKYERIERELKLMEEW